MTAISASKPLVLLGGSFDPVHRGHIEGALAASRTLAQAIVTLLPNARSPLKSQACASDAQRLAMLELAIADHPELALSRYEIERPAPSYMVDSLRHFREGLGAAPLVLVLGADSFAALDQWREWQTFPSLCHLLVLPRPGSSQPGHAVTTRFPVASADALLAQPCGLRLMLSAPCLDISSTGLRAGQTADNDLPPAVAGYIRQHHLYGR